MNPSVSNKIGNNTNNNENTLTGGGGVAGNFKVNLERENNLDGYEEKEDEGNLEARDGGDNQ